MSDFDLSIYLGVFLDEVDEQIQVLDKEIINLENEPKNLETIQKIFRAAHTLKGSSASMGFDQMKEVTHHLENIFDLIRNDKAQVTSDLINVIFESIDFIKVLKDAIVQGSINEIDIKPFVRTLQQVQSSDVISTRQEESCEPAETSATSATFVLDSYQIGVLEQASADGYNTFAVHVRLVEDALMKQVRTLLIHNNLKETGEIIATFPSIEDMEGEDSLEDLTFILMTMQTKEEILQVVNQISDISYVHVSVIEETVIEETSKEELTEKENNRSTVEIEPKDTTPTDKTQKNKNQKTVVTPTVRVDVDRLEHLMNLVGELVIDQTRLVDVRGRLSEREGRAEDHLDVLDEVTNHLSRVISELQEGMMKTRMLPIEHLFNRFPRMVRDTAQKAGKEIEFAMEGKETELDRTLIEEISDPIIHLLRNALDHGIEPSSERLKAGKSEKGKVTLKALHEENHIVITISDDGRGIDHEKLRKASIEKGILTEEEANKMTEKDLVFLIFKSGMSTAKEITDISGRGVGMDIVRAHIEKLNGIIDIDTEIGIGTTFTIKLPLTLAIISSLLVKLGSKTFAVPLTNVLEIIRLNHDEIQHIKEKEVGLVRGRVLPLVRMKERLGMNNKEAIDSEKKRVFVVVVGIADKRIGIIADKTLGNQEIVIKSLGRYIGTPKYISGATIMGDGNVALILDISSIVRDEGTQDLENNQLQKKENQMDEEQFVTFRLADEEYGIEIHRTKDIVSVPKITKVVNAPDGMLGLINLRGNMLPVFDLRHRFNLSETKMTKKTRIIVTEAHSQDVGFLVDEVTQVLKTNKSNIEKVPDHSQNNQHTLMNGIAKVEERVVLLLKFNEVLKSIDIENTKEAILQAN